MPRMKRTLAAALAAAGCAAAPQPSAPDPAASLAAAESAFAAHSVREDMRAAFLAAFSDEGMLVSGGWVRAKEALGPRPAPPIVLDWRPAHVEAARAGDLGLSTGPWKITPRDGTPARHGQFVSVWRREGGTWKVLVDLGISNDGPVFQDAPLEAAVVPRVASTGGSAAQAEREFEAAAAREGLRTALATHGARDMRFYREPAGPLVGREAALASAHAQARFEYRIEGEGAAASDDLAYVRGTYTSGASRGVFLRVWRREAQGWRVAMDVANALSAPP
jgi:hypothetical protein